MKFRVGCDPEIMIRDRMTGMFVSGHDLCPGTKEDPHKVDGGAVQVDGLALEINIDPANSEEEFVDNINRVRGELRKIVPERFEFVYQPSVVFDQRYFDELPPKVKELGCNPDWSAYLGRPNDPPDGHSTTLRTGAGHIHVGWLEPNEFVDPTEVGHISLCSSLVKYMDWFVALGCLEWDKDVTRRQLYGKAGAFRPKKYGVEHRTPSNAWLNNEVSIRKVYQWTMDAIHKFVEDDTFITPEREAIILKALG